MNFLTKKFFVEEIRKLLLLEDSDNNDGDHKIITGLDLNKEKYLPYNYLKMLYEYCLGVAKSNLNISNTHVETESFKLSLSLSKKTKYTKLWLQLYNQHDIKNIAINKNDVADLTFFNKELYAFLETDEFVVDLARFASTNAFSRKLLNGDRIFILGFLPFSIESTVYSKEMGYPTFPIIRIDVDTAFDLSDSKIKIFVAIDISNIQEYFNKKKPRIFQSAVFSKIKSLAAGNKKDQFIDDNENKIFRYYNTLNEFKAAMTDILTYLEIARNKGFLV